MTVLALGRDHRRVLYAICAAVLLFVVGEMVRPGFASAEGIKSVLVVASFVGLVAAGQMFVMLIGVSTSQVPGSERGGILLVTTTGGANARLPLGLAATLGIGAAVGAMNGIGVGVFNVPAVVMTLA